MTLLDWVAVGLMILGFLIMIFGLGRLVLYKLGCSLLIIGSLYILLFTAKEVSPINWICAGPVFLMWVAVLHHKSKISPAP